jgi:pyruvate formate lyase activating enzyme
VRISGGFTTVDQVLAEVERDRVFYEHSGGGMTLSGGEPLLQPAFSAALLQEAQRRGIHSAVETAGWAEEATVKRVLGLTDLILYDIKHMDAQTHKAATGVTNERILHNAQVAARLGVPMVVRTPVVEGFNDQVADIVAIGRFVVSLGVKEIHLLPYHRYGVPKYASLRRDCGLADLSVPSCARTEALSLELSELGLLVHIGG